MTKQKEFNVYVGGVLVGRTKSCTLPISKRYPRMYQTLNDQTHEPEIRTVTLWECKCGDKRRGPEGGVCGRCGQAIPDKKGG